MAQALAPNIATAIHEAVARLRSRFGARLCEVFLFGSHAWGSADEDSDVDLCVILDTLTQGERGAAIEIVAEVGLLHDVLLAPLVWSADELRTRVAHEWALAEDIEQRGVRL